MVLNQIWFNKAPAYVFRGPFRKYDVLNSACERCLFLLADEIFNSLLSLTRYYPVLSTKLHHCNYPSCDLPVQILCQRVAIWLTGSRAVQANGPSSTRVRDERMHAVPVPKSCFLHGCHAGIARELHPISVRTDVVRRNATTSSSRRRESPNIWLVMFENGRFRYPRDVFSRKVDTDVR